MHYWGNFLHCECIFCLMCLAIIIFESQKVSSKCLHSFSPSNKRHLWRIVHSISYCIIVFEEVNKIIGKIFKFNFFSTTIVNYVLVVENLLAPKCLIRENAIIFFLPNIRQDTCPNHNWKAISISETAHHQYIWLCEISFEEW